MGSSPNKDSILSVRGSSLHVRIWPSFWGPKTIHTERATFRVVYFDIICNTSVIDYILVHLHIKDFVCTGIVGCYVVLHHTVLFLSYGTEPFSIALIGCGVLWIPAELDFDIFVVYIFSTSNCSNVWSVQWWLYICRTTQWDSPLAHHNALLCFYAS